MNSTKWCVCVSVVCATALVMWTTVASAQGPPIAPTIHFSAGDINGNGTGADNPADGASVANWIDRVAGQDAAQSGDAPVFNAMDASLNNNPSVEFNGTEGLSASDGANVFDIGTNSFTAFVVASVDENGNNDPQVLFDHRDGGGDRFRGDTFFLEFRSPGQTSDGSGAGMTVGAQVNAPGGTPVDVSGFNTPADNDPGGNGSANPLIPDEFEDGQGRILSVVFDRSDDADGTGVFFGINSLATIQGASDSGGILPPTDSQPSFANADFTIGFGPNFGGGGIRLDGRIGEILLYHSELSEADQTQVLDFLSGKYDIGIVPEPSTCVLVLLGALGMIAIRRRGRS